MLNQHGNPMQIKDHLPRRRKQIQRVKRRLRQCKCNPRKVSKGFRKAFHRYYAASEWLPDNLRFNHLIQECIRLYTREYRVQYTITSLLPCRRQELQPVQARISHHQQEHRHPLY